MSCCSDVMKPLVGSSCCTPKESAAQAARAMRDSGCGCAPIVENRENLKLVGVVTERDVCCSVVADDRHGADVAVEEIMQPAHACCTTDQSIEHARHKLQEYQAASLPVVNKAGSCCGPVSVHELHRP